MSRPARAAETAREGCARKLRGEVVASVVDEPSVDSGRRARRIAAVEVLAEHAYGVPRLLEVLGKVPAPAQTGTLMQRATCSIRHATCTTQHALLHRTCRAVRRQSALSDGTALATCECSGQTDIGRQTASMVRSARRPVRSDQSNAAYRPTALQRCAGAARTTLRRKTTRVTR
jgi:hypothetical protein